MRIVSNYFVKYNYKLFLYLADKESVPKNQKNKTFDITLDLAIIINFDALKRDDSIGKQAKMNEIRDNKNYVMIRGPLKISTGYCWFSSKIIFAVLERNGKFKVYEND